VLATVLVGIAASLLGGIIANLFDVGWIIQFIVAVALAAVGIALFASTEHRRSP
jgi:ABC-type multidrug transport system permease subunit